MLQLVNYGAFIEEENVDNHFPRTVNDIVNKNFVEMNIHFIKQ